MRLPALIALTLCVSISACDDKASTPALDVLIVDTATGTDVTTEDVAVTPDSAVEDAVSVEDIATPPEDTTPEDVAPDLSEPADTMAEDTTNPDVTPTDVATSNGACDNTADRAELDEEAENINGYNINCAIGCISEPDQALCNTTCLNNIPAWTVTESCTTCFGAVAACTSTQCVFGNGGPCFTFDLTKPPTAACVTCQKDYCFPDFEVCAGIEIPTATP